MKRVLSLALLACAVSCGPMRHVVNVEMRHPSMVGVDLAGKNVSVVYLENGDKTATDFNAYMADGFAYTLEQDYGTGEGSVGIYRMQKNPAGDYSSKDSLFNILMDTGSDVVFLFDTVKFGNMSVGAPSKVAYSTVVDSSYITSGSIPYTLRLYCFDAMNKEDKVQAYGGTAIAGPAVYSNGKMDSETTRTKAFEALGAEGWDAGVKVAGSFVSQWKHEQYSLVYYESEQWYDALDKAEEYDWKGAMDIWLGLLGSNDLMKHSCAAYDIAVACYMLGDYHLASEWLDLSDTSNKLPLSDGLRKRINDRIK